MFRGRAGRRSLRATMRGTGLRRFARASRPPTTRRSSILLDYRDRLEQVLERPSPTGTISRKITYRYDMFDHLTRRIEDTDGEFGLVIDLRWEYIGDGDELVASLLTHSTDATKLQIYAYGPGTDMVLFEDDAFGGTLHTLLGDHQNTVWDVVDTSGTVENHRVSQHTGK